MREAIAKITENTFLPISLVMTFIGFTFWITTIYAQVGESQAKIIELKAEQQESQRILRSIDSRLSHIEGALKIKGR